MLKVIAALAVLVTVGISILLVRSDRRVHGPEQPIAFSHKLHAGDYQITCLYCHSHARRSAVAGIPSVQFCMGCHKNLRQDQVELHKLIGYWRQQAPIPWVRVYDVPDFVYFSHKRHVLARVDCGVCHGPVETMNSLTPVGPLNMQRCVQCHRERKASTDCVTCHK